MCINRLNLFLLLLFFAINTMQEKGIECIGEGCSKFNNYKFLLMPSVKHAPNISLKRAVCMGGFLACAYVWNKKVTNAYFNNAMLNVSRNLEQQTKSLETEVLTQQACVTADLEQAAQHVGAQQTVLGENLKSTKGQVHAIRETFDKEHEALNLDLDSTKKKVELASNLMESNSFAFLNKAKSDSVGLNNVLESSKTYMSDVNKNLEQSLVLRNALIFLVQTAHNETLKILDDKKKKFSKTKSQKVTRHSQLVEQQASELEQYINNAGTLGNILGNIWEKN